MDESAYEDDEPEQDHQVEDLLIASPKNSQLDFDIAAATTSEDNDAPQAAPLPSPWREPSVRKFTDSELSQERPEVLVLGLGFEERTLVSAERLLAIVEPVRIVLVRYPETGYAEAIERAARTRCENVTVVDYDSITRRRLHFRVLRSVAG